MQELLRGLQIDPGARTRGAPAPRRLDARSPALALIGGLLVVLGALGLWLLRTAPMVVDAFTRMSSLLSWPNSWSSAFSSPLDSRAFLASAI